MRGRYEFIILSKKYEEEMNVDVDYSMPLVISAVLEFSNNLGVTEPSTNRVIVPVPRAT
jgi:hypothetical protein